MNRRQFAGRLFAFFALLSTLGSALVMSGCNLFTDIMNWIPVGEAALNSILSVLTGNGVVISPAIQSIVALIEAAFAALTAAIKEYQSTTPPPVGALAKIETAFADLANNFTTFLSSLNVSGGLLGIITGLAQVVFSTIAAFVNQLPASASLKRTTARISTVKVGPNVITVTPKMRTRRAFKKDWNATLKTAPSVGVICPASAYLPVSFFERF